MPETKTYSIFADAVRLDNDLPFSCRILFSEIAALSKLHGYCFASNSYFAERFNVSISSVSKWIHMLEKKEYVLIEYIRRGCHVQCRKIYLNLNLCDGYKYLKNKHPSNCSSHESNLLEVPLPTEAKDNNILSKNKDKRIGTYGNLHNVYLTEFEYKQLQEKCGMKEVHILINDLSYHIGSTGKKYKSHYNTIISWYRKKASKKVKRPTSWYCDYEGVEDES